MLVLKTAITFFMLVINNNYVVAIVQPEWYSHCDCLCWAKMYRLIIVLFCQHMESVLMQKNIICNYYFSMSKKISCIINGVVASIYM